MEKHKEYNLRYLLAKVRNTRGKASDRFRQRVNKRNKNRVGRLPTSDQNWKVILSDRFRQRENKRNQNRVGRLPTSDQNWKIILSDDIRHRANKGNKNCVGRLPTSDHNWKIILSDRLRQRANKRNKNRVGRLPISDQNWKSYCRSRSDVGSKRVKIFWIFSTDFLKIFKYRISWKSVHWEPICSMRVGRATDRQTWQSFPQF
jgi:hypothetical protein